MFASSFNFLFFFLLVLWCELHGVYLAVWKSMVAWLNSIKANESSSLGDDWNQNDPLLMKHDFWLLSSLSDVIYSKNKNAVLIVFVFIFTVLPISPMRLHPVPCSDMNALFPEIARGQFRWHIKRCSCSCSDIGSVNTLTLILLVAVLCSAHSHSMHRLQTHAGALTQKGRVHVFVFPCFLSLYIASKKEMYIKHGCYFFII